MQSRTLLIFFSIVLTMYGIINYYIFLHGESLVLCCPEWYPWYVALFLVVSLSFIGGRILERIRITPVSSVLIWLGSFWLAAVLYFFLAAVAADIVSVLNHFIPMLPSLHEPRIKFYAALASLLLVTITVAAGAVNARSPRIRSLKLDINKPAPTLKNLHLVVVSDIHLGTIICRSRLERIVKKINSLDADIVLLPGDVVDEDIGPVIKQNLGETLRKVRSKYGVFAVTGNHEYIGGVEAATEYLVEHGIVMLRDAVVKIADSVYIIGREDASYNRRGHLRKSLPELMKNIDKNLFLVLMDHQPFRLNEAEENGVDLQLSGHTHHGQLWPLNYITQKIFEVSWGYQKKGNTHFYVSCGVGSWGPPVRIGNTPEIINIKLTFS